MQKAKKTSFSIIIQTLYRERTVEFWYLRYFFRDNISIKNQVIYIPTNLNYQIFLTNTFKHIAKIFYLW